MATLNVSATLTLGEGTSLDADAISVLALNAIRDLVDAYNKAHPHTRSGDQLIVYGEPVFDEHGNPVMEQLGFDEDGNPYPQVITAWTVDQASVS